MPKADYLPKTQADYLTWHQRFTEKVAAMAIGKPYPEFKEVKLDPALLDAFVGIYKIDANSQRVVTRDGDKLFGQRTGGPKTRLMPYSADGFFVANAFTNGRFVRNDKGVVTEMVTIQRGSEQSSPRVSTTPPVERTAIALTPAKFDRLVGEYQLAPGFVLAISRDENRFFAQATGQGKNEIFAESERQFFLKVIDAQLVFAMDEAGNATQLTLLQGGREMPGKKTR